MSQPNVTRVVAAYIEERGKVLVQQRPAHKARGGFWELPGGKVDPGESDADALKRELHEELSIKADIHDEIARHEHGYGDLRILLIVYRTSRSGDLQPTEGQPIAWHTHEELLALALCDADRAILSAHATM